MIWTDSFFDKKDLTTKESFNISKKLFWPFLKLNVLIFFRYYLVMILSLPVMLLAGAAIGALAPTGDWQAALFLLVYLFIIIGYIWWFYYTRIKLRYIRFVFLDTYNGTSLNMADTARTVNQLNQIFKSESFKKALVSQLGVGTAHGITSAVTTSMASMLAQGGSMLGGLGGESVKAVVGIANTYAQAYARQVASLASVVGMYVLYREALKQLTGNEQVINEYIYNLK